MTRVQLKRWAVGLAGLGLITAIAAGGTGVIQARPAGSELPVPSYKMIGAHAMLTKDGYRKLWAAKGTDYAVLGSVPVGAKMTYGGGPVLVHPKVFITYWGWNSDPHGIQPYLNGFFGGLGGSDWIGSQSQYCEGVPTSGTSCDGGQYITNLPNILGGVWNDHQDALPPDPIPEPSTGTSPDLADEALRSVEHFGYVEDGVYVIATPHGTNAAGFDGLGYCAWHGAVQLPDGRRVQFVNMPYVFDAGSSCGADYVNKDLSGQLDGVSMVAGHEYAEAITDPTVSFNNLTAEGLVPPGWYSQQPEVGGETGDKCAYPVFQGRLGLDLPQNAANIILNGKPYAVQPLWSNDANDGAGGCVITDTPGPVAAPALPAIPGTPTNAANPVTCTGAQIVGTPGDAVDPYTSVNVVSSNQPALNILNVQFSTPSASTLEIKTTLDNLQPFPQQEVVGGIWSVYWNYGGQTYVASVTEDPTGTVYEDGVHSSSTGDTFNNTNDTGSFNPGPNGTVVIDVPRAHVGNPPDGALLTKTWAVSFGEVPGLSGVISFPSDEAPSNNPENGGPATGWPYKVGSMTDCDTVRTLPPAPADNFKLPPPPPPFTIGVCSGDNLLTAPSGNVHVPLPEAPTTANLEAADITGASFAVDPSAGTLTTTLQIANLNQLPVVGTTETDYNVSFNLPDGRTYATQEALPDPTGTNFKAGLWNRSDNRFLSSTPETGSVNMGAPGTVVVVAKLADLGSPSATSSPLVTQTYADTISAERVAGEGYQANTPDKRVPARDFGPAWPICSGPSVTAVPITALAGERFSGIVARFADDQTDFPSASDLSATINWGDGTQSAGTLTGKDTRFAVEGAHTYSSNGTYTVRVTVAQRAGGSAVLGSATKPEYVGGAGSAGASASRAAAAPAGAQQPSAAPASKAAAAPPNGPIIPVVPHGAARPPAMNHHAGPAALTPVWAGLAAALVILLLIAGLVAYRHSTT
ncbi:MAG TPA: hypothetical protein VF137_05190 [Candidatus Dormibacteraeota bacterium]